MKPFPIPRVRRSGGYRSKAPDASGGTSWYTYDPSALKAAVDDTHVSTRGLCGQGWPTPGLLAAIALGARIVK
jgi:hypothetical protein